MISKSKQRIFLSPPHMGGREFEYVKQVFESNYIAPVGEFISCFEKKVCEFTRARYALALSSGTAAIHLALKILGIGENDKVLASTFTFIGSIAPILYQGAEPIFIDSDDTWNIDPNLVEHAIKKNRPKAMVITHLYGQCARIEELMYLSKKYKVHLIEDAAESLGATYMGRHAGTFGDFGIYSFNGNKIITTGGGGMLVSNNKEWINKARFLSTQAREDCLWYEHKEYGYNYRMSNVLAAIGVGQIEILRDRIEKKRKIFQIYFENLCDIAEFMPEIPNSRGNRWLTTIVFKDQDPFEVIRYLNEKNIESRPLWKPMHMQPVFKGTKSYLNGISEDLFKKGMCLPSGSSLEEEQILTICEYIRSCVL